MRARGAWRGTAPLRGPALDARHYCGYAGELARVRVRMYAAPMPEDTWLVGGRKLSLQTVAAVGAGQPVAMAPEALARVARARDVVIHKATGAQPVYGVSTGFGALAEIKIPPDQISQLQRNLILSHAAGVGRPLPRIATRAMMLLRAQTLAAGHSGVRPEVIKHLLTMLNRGIHPCIPEKGSVGASGDLAPLAHLALAMIGEGEVTCDGRTMPAMEAFAAHGMEPIVLQAKEGLSLINGTQAMAALGSLAILQSQALCTWADTSGAMSLEALCGIPSAFDSRIQALRPHPGQVASAAHLRTLLSDSELNFQTARPRVQDPYSLRCMPQVHGASRDALQFCTDVLEREINSVTDNPLVFPDEDEIVSGGNFHGQPLALALDFAAMAVAELANIAERRIEQLLNPSLSGLPAFLAMQGGIHSGYMIAQLTAASLVNENKVLCTPASVDSIPGNANREDHVSMGMTSARKLRVIVGNTTYVLAIELLCAAQAIDMRASHRLGRGVQQAYDRLREQVPTLDVDRILSRDIEAAAALLDASVTSLFS